MTKAAIRTQKRYKILVIPAAGQAEKCEIFQLKCFIISSLNLLDQ